MWTSTHVTVKEWKEVEYYIIVCRGIADYYETYDWNELKMMIAAVEKDKRLSKSKKKKTDSVVWLALINYDDAIY